MATKATSLLTKPQPIRLKVIRKSPELIPPIAPTPYEFKELSDIDDQNGLRWMFPLVMYYPNGSGSREQNPDPVRVIKEALGKALVPYYPLAGRLREKSGRKLEVECNGEGILFIEADAPNTSLDDFDDADFVTPVACFDQLLVYDHSPDEILHSPLMVFQVTRLKCGGFIMAMRINHTLLDAAGSAQFLNTVAEIARGVQTLSVWPVWDRHLLRARDPPRVTCFLQTYEFDNDDNALNTTSVPITNSLVVAKSFFFGPTEIASLRRLIPPHLQSSSNFDVLTACLWWCRTIAIQPSPDEKVRFMMAYSFRSKKPLPKGYYGNTMVFPMAVTTAHKLCSNPLAYAIELVKKAKADVTDDYIRSTADLMVLKDRPSFNPTRCFTVSDITKDGYNFDHLDFGWGKPLYAGPTLDGVVAGVSSLLSSFVPFKNRKGEKGLVANICLPRWAMERFIKEVEGMLSGSTKHTIVTSNLWSAQDKKID